MPESVCLKQITVFLENRAGRLAAICNALGEQKVNILALSLADTADFGILRLVVDDPDTGIAALKTGGFTVAISDIVAVDVPDHPGGMGEVLDVLVGAGVNVEYLYAFAGEREGYAPIAFRFSDTAEGVRALRKAGINVQYRGPMGDQTES